MTKSKAKDCIIRLNVDFHSRNSHWWHSAEGELIPG